MAQIQRSALKIRSLFVKLDHLYPYMESSLYRINTKGNLYLQSTYTACNMIPLGGYDVRKAKAKKGSGISQHLKMKYDLPIPGAV